MKRRHISMFPLLEAGHVNPILEMCEVLVRRGYRVTCVTTERFVQKIRQAGAEPVTIKAEISSADVDLAKRASEEFRRLLGHPRDPAWWEIYAKIIYPRLLVIATNTLQQVEEFYGQNIPDVIIYDRLAFSGRILAHRLSCRTVQIYPHFAFYRNFIHREQGVCVNPPPMLEFAAVLDSYMSKHGIQTQDNLWYSDDLNIYFIPGAFQHHEGYFDDHSCFVGACLARSFKSEWRDRSGGRPVYLVSDISEHPDPKFFNTVVEALSGEDCHCVLSIGPQMPEGALRSLPENCDVNRSASHLEILSRATLAICHGGTGTSLEAVYNGVPVLALPPTPPTGETAYRLGELGVGVQLPRELMTPSDIRQGVSRVLGDSALLKRVKEIQAEFLRCGGARLAVDRIEEFLVTQ